MMKGTKKTVSALDVSQHLLSLDPKRKYFTKRVMSSEEGGGNYPPVEGNFRLNKMLHILQIFYYVKYGELLFSEDMIAHKNGAIVESIMKSFPKKLFGLENYLKADNLSSNQKNFIKSKYNHFREYTDHELEEFSHDDLSGQLARKNGKEDSNNIMSRESNILDYGKKFYSHCLKELEEDEI